MIQELCKKHNQPATHGCIICKILFCKGCKNLEFYSETKLHLKLPINQYHSELSLLVINPQESDKWTGELRQLILAFIQLKKLHNIQFKKTEYQYCESRLSRNLKFL